MNLFALLNVTNTQVYIDDRLNFAENVHNLYKKCLQRVRHLREPVNIRVDREILSLFYRSIIESVMSYSIASWFGLSHKKDFKKLNKIIRIARRLGLCTHNLTELFNDSCYKIVLKILADHDHPLHQNYIFMRSGRRLMALKQRTSRFGNSFVPASVKLYNHLTKK